ncbi:MAG: hypothetical protein ACREQP_08130 [Candidatus Binatia bacterium]
MRRIVTTMAAFSLGAILLAGGCVSQDRTIEATVAVDFGPANRAGLQKTVAVSERSTVIDALKSAFPIVTSGR